MWNPKTSKDECNTKKGMIKRFGGNGRFYVKSFHFRMLKTAAAQRNYICSLDAAIWILNLQYTF